MRPTHVRIGHQSRARRIGIELKKILSNIEHPSVFVRIYLRPGAWWRRVFPFRTVGKQRARSNPTGWETREEERLWLARIHQACWMSGFAHRENRRDTRSVASIEDCD